jgi:hypothetical protein
MQEMIKAVLCVGNLKQPYRLVCPRAGVYCVSTCVSSQGRIDPLL